MIKTEQSIKNSSSSSIEKSPERHLKWVRRQERVLPVVHHGNSQGMSLDEDVVIEEKRPGPRQGNHPAPCSSFSGGTEFKEQEQRAAKQDDRRDIGQKNPKYSSQSQQEWPGPTV